MESFIEQKDLLSSSQYGFRKAHSTQHAILDIVNAIQTNMDKKLFSCGVFIDLKNLLILSIIISYCINLITMAFVALLTSGFHPTYWIEYKLLKLVHMYLLGSALLVVRLKAPF